MFTGIVEELGTIAARAGSRLRISATTVLDGSGLGASIAVNGCCLTLVASGDDWWEAEV
ncbi:MAG: riboflavin synthase, partial [Actinomycetota bacterium]